MAQPEYSGGSGNIRLEAIGEAWNLFSKNMATWIVALLVFIIILGVVGGIMWFVFFAAMIMGAATGAAAPEALMPGFSVGAIIGGILFWAVIMIPWGFLSAGLFKMAVGEVRGRQAQVGDLFGAPEAIVPMIILAVVLGILTSIGSYLCLIPGLIIGGLTLLAYPLVVDQRLGAFEAISRSIDVMKSQIVMAAILYLILSILMGVGFMVCGIGFLFTGPLWFLTISIVYRDMFPERFAGASSTGPAPPAGSPPGPPSTPPPPDASPYGGPAEPPPSDEPR